MDVNVLFLWNVLAWEMVIEQGTENKTLVETDSNGQWFLMNYGEQTNSQVTNPDSQAAIARVNGVVPHTTLHATDSNTIQNAYKGFLFGMSTGDVY